MTGNRDRETERERQTESRRSREHKPDCRIDSNSIPQTQSGKTGKATTTHKRHPSTLTSSSTIKLRLILNPTP